MNDKLIEYEKHVKTLSFEDLIKEYEHICDLTDNKYIEISNDCIEEVGADALRAGWSGIALCIGQE